VLDRCLTLALGKHDENVVYELPYDTGGSFTLIQGYGGAYSHTLHWHYSLDFAMPPATRVCAARGVVVTGTVDEFTVGGSDPKFKGEANRVEVRHDDNSIAAYLHLCRGGVLVALGQRVCAGQLIGLSGDTGWSSQPHLHFHVTRASDQQCVPTRFRVVGNTRAYLVEGHNYVRPQALARLSRLPAFQASFHAASSQSAPR